MANALWLSTAVRRFTTAGWRPSRCAGERPRPRRRRGFDSHGRAGGTRSAIAGQCKRSSVAAARPCGPGACLLPRRRRRRRQGLVTRSTRRRRAESRCGGARRRHRRVERVHRRFEGGRSRRRGAAPPGIAFTEKRIRQVLLAHGGVVVHAAKHAAASPSCASGPAGPRQPPAVPTRPAPCRSPRWSGRTALGSSESATTRLLVRVTRDPAPRPSQRRTGSSSAYSSVPAHRRPLVRAACMNTEGPAWARWAETAERGPPSSAGRKADRGPLSSAARQTNPC